MRTVLSCIIAISCCAAVFLPGLKAQTVVFDGGQVVVDENLVIHADHSITYREQRIEDLIASFEMKGDANVTEAVGLALRSIAYVADPFNAPRTDLRNPVPSVRFQPFLSAASDAMGAHFARVLERMVAVVGSNEQSINSRKACAEALEMLLHTRYSPPKSQQDRIAAINKEANSVLRTFPKAEAEERERQRLAVEKRLDAVDQMRAQDKKQILDALQPANSVPVRVAALNSFAIGFSRRSALLGDPDIVEAALPLLAAILKREVAYEENPRIELLAYIARIGEWSRPPRVRAAVQTLVPTLNEVAQSDSNREAKLNAEAAIYYIKQTGPPDYYKETLSDLSQASDPAEKMRLAERLVDSYRTKLDTDERAKAIVAEIIVPDRIRALQSGVQIRYPQTFLRPIVILQPYAAAIIPVLDSAVRAAKDKYYRSELKDILKDTKKALSGSQSRHPTAGN